EKGDATDEAFRERVYRSAFSVLEKALAGRASITPEEADSRRERLRACIIEIESEFVPALPEIEPEVARLDIPAIDHPAPRLQAGDPIERPMAPKAAPHRARPKRRLITILAIALAGFFLLAIAGWWLVFG